MLGSLARVTPSGRMRLGPLRLPARTARLRLTLLYSGMFLALGTALIVVIYVLATAGPPIHARTSSAAPASVAAAPPAPVPPAATGPIAVTPGASGAQAVSADPGAQQHSADLNRLLEASWLVLAVTAVASAVLGWFAAGRVLRPLRQMTATARTISAGNLSERLALSGPNDEFKQLGDTLDQLLARLEASFEAQRRFVANASHELRTPLTVERTLLQVALADHDASAATLRATCEELLSTGEEQEHLLEALLTLASSERGLDCRESLDLASIAGHALMSAEGEIERRGLSATFGLEPSFTSGDAQLIERLIANLLGNATEYNRPGGVVEVRTATVADEALVTVANTGPPVAPDDLELLFEPFQRLDGGRAARPDGHHGLGLSIVRAIATAHGATVSAEPQRDGGLSVVVRFPSMSGERG
jgi:signal transduction histidine kinase